MSALQYPPATGKPAQARPPQRQAAPASGLKVNVGKTERTLSGFGGAVAVGYGLSRGSLGGLVLAALGGGLIYRSVTGHCTAYNKLGIDTAEGEQGRTGTGTEPGAAKTVRVRRTFTVAKPAEECYRYWRQLDNLPKFMTHLNSVKVTGDMTSHWEAKAPLGRTVAWDAEITEDQPNKKIAWKSVGEPDIENEGSVEFHKAPGDRGTLVTAEVRYNPPGGKLGATLAWLLGEEPEIQVTEDLRHFKEVMETGEIATVEGQSTGR